MARVLSKEVAKRNITVNCVSPGFIDTELLADLSAEHKAQFLEMVPMKRFGTAAEVAHAVLFLATKEAGYITGATIEVTGGI
jgi:3-oxoacyl-[acyl-carrier protein] reductase